MRLIDADELRRWLNGYLETDNISPTYIRALIDSQQTVEAIPIDKPFLKMKYKGYTVYKTEWLKEHIEMEYRVIKGISESEAEAIPIEWLKKQVKEGWYDIIEIMDHWELENNIKKSILWSEENDQTR